jgi:hypothetical protein
MNVPKICKNPWCAMGGIDSEAIALSPDSTKEFCKKALFLLTFFK